MATSVQNISLTDYDSQMAEFARRQRMAQALQEQAAAPIEVQSYKGIQAPISSLSILSKALKSYAGARGERKAVEEKGALDKLARELAATRGSSYMPAEEPAPAPTAIAPQALAAALGAQPVMDTQSGASRAAGIASNPLAVAAPPPAAPPPGMVPNTQSGASIAMGMGPNPNAAPAPPPAAPPPAPAGAMAPINVQPPRPAGPSVAQLQAGLSRAISDADSDPNTYVRQNAARMIPVIQQRISRAQQQADTADTRSYNEGRVTEARSYEDAHTEALRTADVKRATDQAEALIAGGQFSDAQANVIRQTAAAGSEALNAVRSTIMTKAFADHNSVLTPEQVRVAGFPVGSVVSRNDTSNDIKLEYNPLPDQTAALNAKTAQYNAQSSRITAEASRDKATGPAGSTPAGRAAIAKAIAENRLDATRVNGRNQLTYETTLLQTPNMNFMNNHSIAAVSSNAPTAQKIIALQALPDVIENVKEAGQKLKFSNFSPVGMGQAWARGITNDPDYRNYMAQRNDAVMAIGNAMRMVGMSDKSIEQEIKAAPESMSPRAFEAWATGQLQALQPKLSRMTPFAINTDASNNVTPAAPGATPAPTHTAHTRPPSISADVWAHMTPAEQDLF